jgi:hypothetical protein
MMAAGVMSVGPPLGPGALAGGPFGFGEGYGAYGDYWASWPASYLMLASRGVTPRSAHR